MTDQSIAIDANENKAEGQIKAQGQTQTQKPAPRAAEAKQTKQKKQKKQEEDFIYFDGDYTPDFIHNEFLNPPVLPDEKDLYDSIFESYELDLVPGHRPKTDYECFLTRQAAVATVELMRYDQMKAGILHSRQVLCAETAYRRMATAPSTKKESAELNSSSREAAVLYFTEPAYRAEFVARLKKAGLPANTIEADAFLRCLPDLGVVERMTTSTERRLDRILQKLKYIYARRPGNQPMPVSLAVVRLARELWPTANGEA